MSQSTPLVLYSHKKQIVEAISATGLPAADFSWCDFQSEFRADGLIASTIQHKSGVYFCSIDRKTNGNWVLKYCPGDREWTSSYESYWENALAQIKKWAGYLDRELKAEDFLETVMGNDSLIALPLTDADSLPFDEDEKATLRDQLNRLEQHVLAIDVDREKFASDAKQHFEFLHVQLERSDRRAFFYSLFGTVVTIGTTYLGTEATRQLLNFVSQQFVPLVPLLMHLR